MSNYNSLKTTIDANIKQNGRQEITGQVLNSVLNQMVNILGTGYQFAGVATTATNPGTPDAKVFYIANGKGTYTNFGGLEVTEDEVVVLYWDSSWHKVSTGIASQAKLTELDQEAEENRIANVFLDKEYFDKNCYIANTGAENPSDNTITGGYIKVFPGKTIRMNLNGFKKTISLYDSLKVYQGIAAWFDTAEYYTIPNDIHYIRVSIKNSDGSNIDHTTFGSYIMLYNQIEPNAIPPTYLYRSGIYYNCTTASDNPIKDMSIDGFALTVCARFVIRMANANTASGEIKLSINGTSKTLYYNGSAASSVNTWKNGETLDVYYNGSAFMAVTLANLKQGKGTNTTAVMSQKAVTDAFDMLRSTTVGKILNNGYFDKQGYYLSNGSINPNDNFLTGDLLPVVPGTRYIVSHLNGNTCAIFHFDKNKSYLGYDFWYNTEELRVIPNDAQYIAVGLKNTNGLLISDYKDYVVIKEDKTYVNWQNKNIVANADNTFYFQNERTRGCSGILKFDKRVFVGLKRTEETELGTEDVTDGGGIVHKLPVYKVITNYNFFIAFIKDGKIDHEIAWAKYEQEIPANTEFVIILKYQNDDSLSYSDRRTVDVSALNDVVCISEEHIPLVLPKYYIENNYLDGKVAFINSLIKGCATNGDIFFHISDLHWQGNQQHSPALIKYIAERVPIKRIFNTGDDFDGTAFRASSTLYVNVNPLNPIKIAFPYDYHWVVGNHDHLLGYENSYNDLCAQKQQLNTKAVFGGTTHSYYYVDNQQQKIRYIILDAFDAGEGSGVHVGPIQQAWLQNTALNVENGWTIILFIHMIYYGNVYSEKFDFVPLSGWGLQLANILTEYSGNGTIAAVFQGDAHCDRVFRLPNSNIPVICTTTDKCDGGMNQIRTVGTINEQAFDVVVLDKTNRKFTCVRVGALARDGVGLTSEGDSVEYREIEY